MGIRFPVQGRARAGTLEPAGAVRVHWVFRPVHLPVRREAGRRSPVPKGVS
jgi:hypothetical protein